MRRMRASRDKAIFYYSPPNTLELANIDVGSRARPIPFRRGISRTRLALVHRQMNLRPNARSIPCVTEYAGLAYFLFRT
jgi:hypothetical protein